jgi:hypothetical protein
MLIEYTALVSSVRELVEDRIPDDALVLVVSRGDQELLRLGVRRAWHFPREASGAYTGSHPADSAEAVKHLEELRWRGATHLLFPSTSLWWLEHYTGLREHLERGYERVVNEDDTCWIYSLTERPAARDNSSSADRQLRELLDALLPPRAPIALVTAGDAVPDLGDRPVLPLPGRVKPPPRLPDARFLVVPEAASLWLDENGDLLEREHRLVIRQQHVCVVYELGSGSCDS